MSLNLSLKALLNAAQHTSKRCLCRCYHSHQLTNAEVRKKRCAVFDQEKKRQQNLITRVEKITVKHEGIPEDCTLVMNKDVSTPYNCAMHLGERIVDLAALALVNDQVWDMHRPLTGDCTLKFLHFQADDPTLANMAFWRSCSFVLGHILETAFKDEHFVEICGVPEQSIETGSFIYDAHLPFEWTPKTMELKMMDRIASDLAMTNTKFEPLEINATVAKEMFQYNKFQSQVVERLAANGDGKIRVYRAGDHIEICEGPLIESPKQIRFLNVVAVHPYQCSVFGSLSRVQGLALPKQLQLHYTALKRLSWRAKRGNKLKSVGASLP